MKQLEGQITIFDFLSSKIPVLGSCSGCICSHCLYYQSGRCPYGRCYDSKRSVEDPYDQAHPGTPVRKSWSNWNKPNEQKFWCRGRFFYPVIDCPKFVKFLGVEIQECVLCMIEVYQDGHVNCSIKGIMSCDECIAESEGKKREQNYGCRYMTENGCEAHIFAQRLLLDAIMKGSEEEPCKEQCCIGCSRQGNCGYRCGR